MTEDVDGPCGAWTSAEIRAELDRVLASPQFEASERNRRFLVYVIEETFAGRAGRIKAYNIATDVFGRDANFDPQLDPVVRMEARRLRRSLERFYLTEGKSSPLRIAMPKGGYVPEFQDAGTVEAPVEGDTQVARNGPDVRRPRARPLRSCRSMPRATSPSFPISAVGSPTRSWSASPNIRNFRFSVQSQHLGTDAPTIPLPCRRTPLPTSCFPAARRFSKVS